MEQAREGELPPVTHWHTDTHTHQDPHDRHARTGTEGHLAGSFQADLTRDHPDPHVNSFYRSNEVNLLLVRVS